jgi:hypothetical protein
VCGLLVAICFENEARQARKGKENADGMIQGHLPTNIMENGQ